ncbi:MAG: saccharopine dehydrogenase NADP-binding domain-containing protein, partial [Myxococcota bacterium]
MKKDLDLVLFGATGFTGRYAAARLQQVIPTGLRWGIAGRRPAQLEAIKQRFGLAEDVQVVVADSDDPSSVGAMAARARVLLSTAGPYTRFGSPIVAACVEHHTHYADITGETVWVRRMIDAHHDHAQRAGTFLVPFAGYDSIPSDLATWMLVRHLRESRGQATSRVYGSFRSTGGFSGGTAA